MDIAIIGIGNMGGALAEKLAPFHKIFVYDRNPDKLEHLAKRTSVHMCHDIKQAIQSSTLVILAIKPQNLESIADVIKPLLHAKHVVVSILGGVTLSKLSSLFSDLAIVKMMPNIPIICGLGTCSISFNHLVTKKDQNLITDLFSPLGKTFVIDESKMEAMTSLTGCGPAFMFMMVEAMIDAGIYMGLSSHEAKAAALSMIQGSLALLESSEKSPSELKWLVTSPMGSTIEGIRTLESQALRSNLIEGFIAAFEKSKKHAQNH